MPPPPPPPPPHAPPPPYHSRNFPRRNYYYNPFYEYDQLYPQTITVIKSPPVEPPKYNNYILLGLTALAFYYMGKSQ